METPKNNTEKTTLSLVELDLTPRNKLFVLDYLNNNGKDATRSYLKFYPEVGYQTAASSATRLLKNDKIQAFINQQLQLQYEAASITTHRILSELGRVAFFDPAKMFDEDGNLKQIKDIDPETRAAIAGFDIEMLFEGRGESREHVGNLKKYKVFNKNQALENLAKIRKLIADTQPQQDSPANQIVIDTKSLPDHVLQGIIQAFQAQLHPPSDIADAKIIDDNPPKDAGQIDKPDSTPAI